MKGDYGVTYKCQVIGSDVLRSIKCFRRKEHQPEDELLFFQEIDSLQHLVNEFIIRLGSSKYC